MNISSVLIQTHPEWLNNIIQSIDRFPWLDVHFSDEQGRIIATVEGEDTDDEIAHIRELQATPQVLSVDMVNHYFGEADQASVQPF